jgi:hypothetical protein
MKTNFKKLALMAGVSAAMAGGSMSAHAVIQAVPAPAALVPVVISGDADGAGPSTSLSTTTFRIEVPSSVGLDSIVNLFQGATQVGATIPASGVAAGLSTSVSGAASSATSRLHWYFMDRDSNEVIDSSFPVSANDVVEFTSNNMPNNTGVNAISLGNSAGYLVIVNESAHLGGAPTFAFQADAFITHVSGQTTVVNPIPVFPLTDTADNQAAAPTLSNNVLEDVSGVPAGAPYGGGPIVSPLMSGIRLAAANAGGAPESWLRVIDFPINGQNSSEVYAIWSDRNDSLNTVNGAIVVTPATTGAVVSYDCNENPQSGGSLSVDQQLEFLRIGGNADFLQDDIDLSIGNARGCVTTANSVTTGAGGFIRWFAQANPSNVGGLTSAAYQSGVIVRLRRSSTDGYSQLPVDRGFFTGR